MAKKAKRRGGGLTARGGGRGGGDMDAQIASLEAAVRPKGVRAAKDIADSNDPGVIKLAFKYIRKREKAAGPAGLGSRIEGLLATMSNREANAMRAKLLEAKNAQIEAVIKM